MPSIALVKISILEIMSQPIERCSLVDEALHGMPVEVLEEAPDGWVRVCTHYRYEGWARRAQLETGEERIARWQGLEKSVISAALADVLSAPAYSAWRVTSLPRGALLAVRGEADGDGWVPVSMADGRGGYVKQRHLGPHRTDWSAAEEPQLRRSIADTALSYLGTQYRWGGKTPQGIDCSGLASMAYLLNGVIIYRDADLREGFCMRQIAPERCGLGDLLFFRGHVAVHLGGGRFVHSTGKPGSDGVVCNSLNPVDADYREDLPGILRFGGTIFS